MLTRVDHMIIRPGALLIAMVAVAVAAGAPLRAAPPSKPVVIKAREFLFEPTEVAVRAGGVAFEIKNEGAIAHNFVIEDSARKKVAEIAAVAAGKADGVKASLRRGTYGFACTLPGHREAGMQGTLRVQP
jgi:uncharacterized cupredoxin-like copper-binding protein